MKRTIVAALGLGTYLFAASVFGAPASPPSAPASQPDTAPALSATPSEPAPSAWCYDSYWGWYQCYSN